MPRPRLHDDALRTRLLEVTSEVVSTAGPTALTVRDVAARAGTSASAVYALFGSRDLLLAAVGDEAFRRFAEHLARVPRSADPSADLLALGLAYRTSALADPHFYRIMFEVGGTGARRPGAPAATERATFVVLSDAVRRVLTQAAAHGSPDGTSLEAEVDRVAVGLWGQVHGLVSLELAGLLPGSDDERARRYEEILRSAGRSAFEPAVPRAGATGPGLRPPRPPG